MTVELSPRLLQGGPWTEGYALHVHMLRSSFVDYDEYGHPRFDNVRSPVGELLYQLKYRRDQTAVDQLAEAAESFLRSWKPRLMP